MKSTSRYTFETPEFGLDDYGLHRLRSRFAFESLPYSTISQALVTRGKSVQNWWLLLGFGLLCVSFALYVSYNICRFFIFGHGTIYIQEVVVPIIPAFIGVAAIWQALRVEDILLIRVGQRKLLFPLSNVKTGNSSTLPFYLASRISDHNLR